MNHSTSFYPWVNYAESMYLSPVASHEICSFIGSIKVSKSSRSYNVPVTILKIIRDYISEHLAFLINDSFTSDNFPNILKLARITPIFKKRSRFDKHNYRPISVLSNFSKLFEKATYHRLYRYLEDFKILCPLLFGFRENLQPSLHLFASPLIDNDEFGSGIFIDLKKAFDTVNYAILLTDLNHYRIRGNVHEESNL